MAVFRAFKALRPAREKAAAVAALPYDVVSREEAAVIGKENPDSFLHVDRAEMDLPADTGLYDPEVYKKAKENLLQMEEKGILSQDHKPCYYIYELVRKGKVQTGIAGCASIDDYLNNVVKKHELTRSDKELDRINHVDVCDANTGPIYLACRYTDRLSGLLAQWKKDHLAEYDFTEEDEITHRVWVIDEDEAIALIQEEMEKIPALYIADGHHRSASAFKVGMKRREEHPDFTGDEEFNFFMAAIFPDSDLHIFDYNRVVKDLNGLDSESFLKKIEEAGFEVEEKGVEIYAPEAKHFFGMFIDGKWYRLKATDRIIPDHVIDSLDVAVLQNNLLGPVLGIDDPRTSNRIDFVGGIRGLAELERRVNSDMKVAFAVYPVSISDLLAVSDADMIMPPKSTWFEPKLGSGLLIHML